MDSGKGGKGGRGGGGAVEGFGLRVLDSCRGWGVGGRNWDLGSERRKFRELGGGGGFGSKRFGRRPSDVFWCEDFEETRGPYGPRCHQLMWALGALSAHAEYTSRMPSSTLIPFWGLGSLINPFKQKRAPF